MKEGLIRLTGEKDIFYDSIEKVYRYRMHCPHCGEVISPCRCYHDLDDLLGDIDDVMADYTCSAKCALLMNDGYEDVTEAIREVGFAKDLRTCLKQLSKDQVEKELYGYTVEQVLKALFDHDSHMQISHLKHLSYDEQIDLLIMMGDAEDILSKYGIATYSELKDLTEEQAQKVLDVLTEDGDFDYPHGEDCSI